jgi:hypothetical protein
MINLVIYNVLWKKVEELRNDIQQPKIYELSWSGSKHPSGIYLLLIIVSPLNESAKISKIIEINLIK